MKNLLGARASVTGMPPLPHACVKAGKTGNRVRGEIAPVRARVRNHLTGFYRRVGILLFWVLAHGGSSRNWNLAYASWRTCAGNAFLSFVLCSGPAGRARNLFTARAPVTD